MPKRCFYWQLFVTPGKLQGLSSLIPRMACPPQISWLKEPHIFVSTAASSVFTSVFRFVHTTTCCTSSSSRAGYYSVGSVLPYLAPALRTTSSSTNRLETYVNTKVAATLALASSNSQSDRHQSNIDGLSCVSFPPGLITDLSCLGWPLGGQASANPLNRPAIAAKITTKTKFRSVIGNVPVGKCCWKSVSKKLSESSPGGSSRSMHFYNIEAVYVLV